VIAKALAKEGGVSVAPDSELVALISYLQRLGRVPADSVPRARRKTPVEVAAIRGAKGSE